MDKRLREIIGGQVFENTSKVRSRTMSKIRSEKNKTTEGALRMALVRAQISGWTLQAKKLPGRPDFLFEDAGFVVFVDGCFWHHCPKCGHIPKSRSEYWQTKLEINKARDERNTRRLRGLGFGVIRFWEHDLKSPETVFRTVERIKRRLKLTKQPQLSLF
jgi:DNA mismatch endonuclease (patch repair protein)